MHVGMLKGKGGILLQDGLTRAGRSTSRKSLPIFVTSSTAKLDHDKTC